MQHPSHPRYRLLVDVGAAARPTKTTAAILRASIVAFIGLAVALPGCGPSADSGVLRPQDKKLPEGVTFDPTSVMTDSSFVDTTPADVAALLQFLQKTPYDAPSFLATYASNGVTAPLAIVRASRKYRINPIVFLAHAERAQGLIGSRSYPFPATRVEFVFACGCTAPGRCDLAVGGFDKQVDCLGRALRANFDQLTGPNQATDGGWAVGAPTKTIDGALVTPQTNATAALYQYLPVVGDASSGNQAYFTIYQLYATALSYFDPGG